MAGKVIREGKGEGGHAEQRGQAKRATRIHKRSGAALRGRVMSLCSKHTFVCAYFGTCAANSNAGEEAATRSPQTAYKIRGERWSDQSTGKGCASHA